MPRHVLTLSYKEDSTSPTLEHVALMCSIEGFLDSDCHPEPLVKVANTHREQVAPDPVVIGF